MLERATAMAARADLFFALGSSLVVHPADDEDLVAIRQRDGAELLPGRQGCGLQEDREYLQKEIEDLIRRRPFGHQPPWGKP